MNGHELESENNKPAHSQEKDSKSIQKPQAHKANTSAPAAQAWYVRGLNPAGDGRRPPDDKEALRSRVAGHLLEVSGLESCFCSFLFFALHESPDFGYGR